jgi:mRNA-degrading endonuclease RelE of RelBE toxin-antitoxin system
MKQNWNVRATKVADKQAKKLSEKVKLQLRFLFVDLANKGPAVSDWPNYGKLHGKKRSDKRHCHLQKRKPTYVCCWEIIDTKRKIIEVYYVGTHEKAPY